MLPPVAAPPPFPQAPPGVLGAPPPAIQVRPPPGPPPPPQAAPAGQRKPAGRAMGLSGAEIELIAGVLMGIAGAAALYFVNSHLPQVNIEDKIFNALVFGLLLWGIGLRVGVAS